MYIYKRLIQSLLGVILMLLIGLFFTVSAQEHPQETKSMKKTQGSDTKQEMKQKASEEHPNQATTEITKASLAKAITDYVNREAKLKGGYFMFYDAQEGKSIALKLQEVHKERLAKVAEDVYFACADFKATDGTMYDLDIFMKGKSVDHLQVTEISLHKKKGKPRYTWTEENGMWKKVSVE